MKTATNIVHFTLLGLGLTLAGCGEDPLLLAELIASSDDGEETSPEAPTTEPPEPEVDEPEPPSPPVNVYPEVPGEAQFVDLMLQYCGACHADPNVASADLDYIGDVERLIDNGLIIPGSREESRLYARIVNQSMPPQFIRDSRPSPGEIEFIGDFIDSL